MTATPSSRSEAAAHRRWIWTMERARELVGVIGGMGPLATAEFMRFVIAETPASCDQEHIPMLVYSNPQIPDRTQAIIGDGPSPVPDLVESARLLERAGASFLVCPCNTAHHFLPQVRMAVNIPVIDMVEETAAEVAALGAGRAGLLATEGTIACGVYQKALAALGVEVIVPGNGLQRRVTRAIYAAKAREPLENARQLLGPVLEWARQSARTIILGCTELSVLLSSSREDAGVVDAMRVLAGRVVRRALCARE